MTLIGETTGRPGDDETRVPINIDEGVRNDLRNLLYEPFMRGVGYSEFIRRAVELAWEEASGPDTSGCERAEHMRGCGFCRAVLRIVLKEQPDCSNGGTTCRDCPGNCRNDALGCGC